MIRQCVGGILFLLVAVYSTPASKQILTDDPDYSLPSTITPDSYDIKLTFTEDFLTTVNTFSGYATIKFTVNTEVPSAIKFHIDHNFISFAHLYFGDTTKELVPDTDYTIDSITDIVSIPTEKLGMEVGTSYTVIADYTGEFSTDGYGIYKGSYVNANKVASYFLATQFSPIYARRVFPCFDEPGFKATFDVSVEYPSSVTNFPLLFNTDIKSGPTLKTETKTTTVIFNTTPKMSSYQFALIGSTEFASSGPQKVDDATTYAVWSRSDVKAFSDYAKTTGAEILQQLNDYTGSAYSKTNLKVLNQVALPDLSQAATDSWGLLSSRENLLLWTTDESSFSSKQTITQYIANRIAHQWFGDKVTCKTWTNLFVNEGLSAHLEYVITDKVQSEWELLRQFIVRALQPVLEYDSLDAAPALTKSVSTPQEIKDKFDIIITKKGGSIVRMVENIAGEDVFKAGIKDYVSKTTSATSDDLWTSIKAATTSLPADVTLSKVMENWLNQPGYPLVTVSLDGKNLKITQKRFLLSGDSSSAAKDLKWYIPITYTVSSTANADKFKITTPSDWLTSSDAEKTITLDKEDNDWVVLNNLQTGYYRVNYEDKLWTKIAAALQTTDFGGIGDENRAQIVDDAFNIAKAGQLTYSRFLQIVQFLKADSSYYPWVPAFKAFSYMLQRVPATGGLRPQMITQLTELMAELYKSVKFTDATDDKLIYSLKQELAFKYGCFLGEQTCVDEVKKAFAAYKGENPVKPNKNLRDVIYCTALRVSTDAATDYTFLWGKYTEALVPTEKASILSALGCSSDEASLNALLKEAFEGGNIKSQDALVAFESVYSGSSKGVDLALDYLVKNFAAIVKKFTELSDQRTLITGIADKLTTDAQVTKLQGLIDGADFPANLQATSKAAITAAKSNVGWFAKYEKDLEAFYNPGGGGGAANANHVNIVLMTIVAIFSLLGVMRQ